ncbi:hypothetical protein MMYC01_201281 [Madurella mycetomatis]|uniref:PD-(D/E)XK nuclease-like domain-containing protein n=1 Tax=Madurella mycetomatis TaxID=100816 RepID=A0A175WF18_9PEZI|nr:hypothetical protein MMYC01_201281 [Madurella mycetomatis]
MDRDEALNILRQVESIKNATRQSHLWNRSGAAWNLLVHWPMFQLALSSIQDVMPELITTAQILPAFLPKTGAAPLTNNSDISATTSQGKMVDFALLLMPPSGSPLNMRAVSQSAYGPLRLYSTPVAIKSSGDTEEAKV